MTRSNLHFFAACSILSAVAILSGTWIVGLILFMAACLFVSPAVWHKLDWRVMLLAVFLPAGAMAASIGTVANPLIDQFQDELVNWIVSGALVAFWTVATWLGGIIGWRFIEKLNRATLQEAAERYVSTIIDQLQMRYLGLSAPDLTDLIAEGVDYIKGGNAGTVKQSKVTDDRLQAYIVAAISEARVARKVGTAATAD